ncbi:UNVERIFIED_CONTAM: hypothetical protein FKN15_043671 [Acipenser sinensis]
MDCLLGQQPVAVAAGNLNDTSQQAAPEAPSRCIDEGPRNARTSGSITAAEYRRSSVLEMRLMRRHMQVTDARQKTLFQHTERCQQQQQHKETVCVL